MHFNDRAGRTIAHSAGMLCGRIMIGVSFRNDVHQLRSKIGQRFGEATYFAAILHPASRAQSEWPLADGRWCVFF